MIRFIILIAIAFMGHNSWAQIRDFETTRLMSTAGAGAASILSTEAAILNPSTSAFFNESSMSYHGYRTSLQNESKDRASLNELFPKNNSSEGIFISDTEGQIKGGMAFINQRENSFRRERLILHGSSPMSKTSSMGLGYQYLQDKKPRSSNSRHSTHHQLILGLTQIIDESMTLGLVIVDPTRNTPGEERVLAGFHYNVADRFALIADVGSQYTKDIQKFHIWRASLQLNIFSDLFFRIGRFHDNIQNMKGTGWGLGWIGPRIGIEFAQKVSEQFKSDYIFNNERLFDSSLSFVIKL